MGHAKQKMCKQHRLNIHEFTYRYHAVTTTIVIVVQRWFYRNCLPYFSRNSCLYYTPSSGVDFLLVSFLAVSSQSKSSLTKSSHKHWEGMKTTIDWDCTSQCLHGGAGLHCKPIISPWTYLPDSWKKTKKKKKLKQIYLTRKIDIKSLIINSQRQEQ